MKIKNQNKDKSESRVIEKFSNSEFYFDDCIICQGMKAAEEGGRDLSLEDLRKLFEKANKKLKKGHKL